MYKLYYFKKVTWNSSGTHFGGGGGWLVCRKGGGEGTKENCLEKKNPRAPLEHLDQAE